MNSEQLKILCPSKERCATIIYWCDEDLNHTFPQGERDFIRRVCCTEEYKNCINFKKPYVKSFISSKRKSKNKLQDIREESRKKTSETMKEKSKF